MGMTVGMVCQACAHRFDWSEGPGFMTMVFHCDRCGREKDLDRLMVSDELIENGVGSCRCRGTYRVDAPCRCPKCRSTQVEQDENGMTVLWD